MRNDREWFNSEYYMSPYGENGVLFTAEYVALVRERGQNIQEPPFIKGSIMACFHALRYTDGQPLSHDNMTAIVCLSKMMGLTYHNEYFHRSWWRRLHPRDIGFYLYAKFGLSLFLVPTIISEAYAVFHKQQTNGTLDTDGKLLAWLRCIAFKRTLSFKLFTWILKKRHNMTWNNIFDIYFREEDHPNRRHAKRLYDSR